MTQAAHIVCPHCHTTNRVQTADLARAGLRSLPSCRYSPPTPQRWMLRSLSVTSSVIKFPYWWTFGRPGAARVGRWRLRWSKPLHNWNHRCVWSRSIPMKPQELGARFNIRSIPTLALFVGGREVARQAGAMGAADIVRWTRAHLGGDKGRWFFRSKCRA